MNKITVERNLNGSLVLRDSNYNKMIYYGYSKVEAVRLFKIYIQQMKGGVKKWS